ncbi:MAG TPA: hybrid sensor histidine kinase/response regulator, partial [Polyangiaceae bacterium]
KVDLLLNLVGEIVLSRGQLNAGQESYSHTLREVTHFRARLTQTLGQPAELRATGTDRAARSWQRPDSSGNQALLDDLQRIERVLSESYGELEGNLSRLGLAVGQLRDTVMKLRMVPIARLFTKYQRTVRELSNQLGKQVRVELVGADTELDKVLVERLEDPLLHLVRNAVDHGIESPGRRRQAGKPEVGLVRLAASQRGGQIVVVIQDDGAGLDPERLKTKAVEKGLLTEQAANDMPDSRAFDLIFHAGFSTAQQVSDVSGRGVGMDVVRATIENLKGGVLVRSQIGAGTEIELRLPLTLAITQVLAVRVGSELVALPLDAVVSAQTLDASELETVAQSPCVRVGEELIPLIHLGAALGLARAQAFDEDPQGHVIIVHVGTERLGVVVQHVLGRHEVVIKSLGPLLARTPCAAGATLIGDRIALVVDLVGVAQHLRDDHAASVPLPVPAREPRGAALTLGRILVAEDSDTVRDSLGRELTRAGFQVSTAVDGREAFELARASSFDAVCTDIMMPNMDGYQLIRALRGLPEYRSVPIVVLSSKDARIDSLRGLDAGADAYLSKPADPGQLIRELSALLAKRGA